MKIRVLSAILIVAIFVPLLLIGEVPFAVFMSVISLMGLYELLNARESKKKFPTILKLVAYFIVLCFCFV